MSTTTATDLTATELQVLELERGWWTYAGAKEHAIRADLGWTIGHYYEVLNPLIDDPRALAHDPLVVRRLRRLRRTRQQERAARRLGFDVV